MGKVSGMLDKNSNQGGGNNDNQGNY